MTPKVPRYETERTQNQGIMRTSNAIQRQRHRIERLEIMLARAYYALDALQGMYYQLALMGDIHDCLGGKRGRTGVKTAAFNPHD